MRMSFSESRTVIFPQKRVGLLQGRTGHELYLFDIHDSSLLMDAVNDLKPALYPLIHDQARVAKVMKRITPGIGLAHQVFVQIPKGIEVFISSTHGGSTIGPPFHLIQVLGEIDDPVI